MLGDNDAVLGFFLRLLGIQMERNCRTQKRECSPRAEQKQEARPGLLGGQETFLIDENFSAKCCQISR